MDAVDILYIVLVILLVIFFIFLKKLLDLKTEIKLYEKDTNKNKYGELTPTGKGKEQMDSANTIRTCYVCGKIVKKGKIIGDPLLGMLLFCEDCLEKDKKEHPGRYEY